MVPRTCRPVQSPQRDRCVRSAKHRHRSSLYVAVLLPPVPVLFARFHCAIVLLGWFIKRPKQQPFSAAALGPNRLGACPVHFQSSVVSPRRSVPRFTEQQLRRLCLLLRVRCGNALSAVCQCRGAGAGAPRRARQLGHDAGPGTILAIYKAFGTTIFC